MERTMEAKMQLLGGKRASRLQVHRGDTGGGRPSLWVPCDRARVRHPGREILGALVSIIQM